MIYRLNEKGTIIDQIENDPMNGKMVMEGEWLITQFSNQIPWYRGKADANEIGGSEA